ncbi:unnamed protein product [Sphagnum balticum]
MRRFEIDDAQEAQFREWADKQPKVCYRAGGDAGFTCFEWVFQESNIGTAVKVRNISTGEELDLTDYESW